MKNNPFDNTSQEAREQDYLTSGVFEKKTDARDLHTFFSPYMVPASLTDNEVKLCLNLHMRRRKISERLLLKKKAETKAELQKRFEDDYYVLEKERDNLSRFFGKHAFSMSAGEIAALYSDANGAMYDPVPLSPELIKSPMTRESFACGVKILVDCMDALDR